LSLAVKYRPITLEAVIGQGALVKALGRILQRPKPPPKAYLLTGPSGTGKTTLSRILAARFAGGTNQANIIEIDAATNSGAEAMRDIAAKAHYRAIGASPVKTIIVDEVHRLSSTAFDALLKPIEEPPEHIYWCLCTTRLDKVPETIKTRCVTFTLKPVDEVSIYELLEKVAKAEGFSTSEEVLEAIAERCGGSPRQALTDLELCAHAKSANEARALMQTALQQKGPVDLARLLIGRTKPTWGTVIRSLSAIENAEAESIRIVISNYVAAVLLKVKSENEAKYLLQILECFSTPYQQSDKMAPLLLSIGAAIGMDQ
jgi:DNA polymerase III gamma/tau subunit